jgi:iron complex outermembrane receptor protein
VTDATGEVVEGAADDTGAIYVTGSRIRRDEFNAPAPITIVDPEIAVRQGLMDTSEMIQGSPIASGSSQVTAALSGQYLTNGGSGAQTISLRGLGAERTLVLLNGRRAGPAGTQGAVSSFDLNVLPQSIVQRVDILKDGASSIYGSDAVAGVVNLITKTDTDGVELDLFTSLPYQSGGEVFSGSATWGKTFDGGHVLVSGNYYKQNELERGDRSYLQCGETYVFTDETHSTRADLVDPRTGRYHCGGFEGNTTWGHVWTYDYSYYFNGTSQIPTSAGQGDQLLFQFNYPGDNLQNYLQAIAPAMPGQVSIPAGWFLTGVDAASEAVQNNYHPAMNDDSVLPELERFTLYLDASYEIAPWIEVYTELLYNKRKTAYDASGQVWQFGVGENDEGLMEALFGFDGIGPQGDPQANGFSGPATFSPTAFIDWFDSSQEVDYYRGVFGFRGDISSTWSWDLYGQYSKSEGDYTDQRILDDAIATQDFRGTVLGDPSPCAGTGTVTPISGRQCADVDWYSGRVMYGDFNAAERAFLLDTETGHTDYTQWYVEGSVTGDSGEWFELPGGPIGVAIGGTFRRDEIVDTPGAISLAENVWGGSTSGITAGKTDTLEAFGELNFPVLADVTLVRSLTLIAAGRVTNVKATRASDGFSDSDNGNFTYKLGADWEVTDWLRFRGTYGTSFRAPALFEQFLSNQLSFLDQRAVDPCIQWGINLANGGISQQVADNCAADGVPANHTGAGIEANIYTGGGIGVLESETSKAWTASMILTPRFNFAPHTDFSLAVDYFDIEVNGEIANLGANSVVAGCYQSDFFPDEPLCDLFARVQDLDPSDPDWNSGDPQNIAFVRSSFVNVNSQKNRGVDVTGRIQHDFGGDTTLTLQAQMTWQLEDEVALFEGFIEDENGEAGEPKWVGDFRVMLDHGPWSFFYGLDVVGATDDSEDYIENNGSICPNFVTLGDVCLDLTTPTTFYHSVSMTREIGEQFELTVGVSNLFGQKPPRVSNVSGNGVNDFGQGVLYSQYDLIGTRFFANFNARF